MPKQLSHFLRISRCLPIYDIGYFFPGSVHISSLETMSQILHLLNSEHFFGDNFRFAARMRSKTCLSRSTCSSNVDKNTMISSIKMQHIFKCKSPHTSCINLWYVAGAPVNPKGIPFNSYMPNGHTVKAVLSLCGSKIST